MPEMYRPDSFRGPRPSKGLSYRLSPTGEAVVITDQGLILNSLIPRSYRVVHTPDVPLSHAAVNNFNNYGNILEANLDQVIRTGGFGRAIFAHELGHCIDDDIRLVERRDRLDRQVRYGELPPPERLPAINRVAQIDIRRELSAWGNAVDIARLIGVTEEEFRLMRRLGLQTHSYVILRRLQESVDLSIQPKPDDSLPIFDPRSLDTTEMTSLELGEAVKGAKTVNVAAKRKMATVLGE